MQWVYFPKISKLLCSCFKVSHSENDPHCWFLANRICLVGDYVMIV